MNYDYLQKNFHSFISSVGEACNSCNRKAEDVKIVAVSKTFPPEQILEVHKLGQIEFGENKVQELKSKHDELVNENIDWHLVGHLQTNKVKYIVDFVKLIHSVDSFKLASEINRQASLINRTIDVLIQVNTSFEEQKSGCEVSEAKNLCKEISLLECINIKGLMTIGMFTDDIKIIRENFVTLRRLFDDLKESHTGFKFLSMGMTSDYKIAIEEGSNMIRVGSAIFGYRNYL